MKIGLLIALLLACLTSCSQNKPAPAPTQDATDQQFGVAQWEYESLDASGKAITRGLLTMPATFADGERFLGSWQARYTGPIDQQQQIGPQINGGSFQGALSGSTVSIELNPNVRDNNVRFVGTLEADLIKGTWEYSGVTGPIAKGSFIATRVK